MLKEEQILELSSREYDTLIRKAGQIHEYSINNSYGMRDYFWYYRKTYKNVISEQLYSMVLKEVMNAMIDELKEDRYVVFPFGFGFLKTVYCRSMVRFINGKVKVNGVVDWINTIQLWHSDEEARNKKQLIYKEKTNAKIVKYSKQGNTFKNKLYLCLDIKRSVYKTLTVDYNNKHKIKPLKYG